MHHQMMSKATTANVNRLWRSLSYEWPEVCLTKKGSKPNIGCGFDNPAPAPMLRFIAGEKVRGMATRLASLNNTVGTGLSDLTRLWALQVCDLERQQYGIEQQILQMLQLPEFEAYHKIFDSFDFGPMTRAVVLSRIYPFDRFLRPDGRPIVEWVWTNKGRSRRHRSLGKFRLSLGLGTVIQQSGDSKKEKAGGPAYARAALFCHVKTKVVMTSGYNGSARFRASHCRFYSELSPDVPHRLAVLKTASKITKDLFNALLSANL